MGNPAADESQTPAVVPVAEPAADVMPADTRSIPVRFGMMPQSIEEAWRLSKMLAASELVPENYRGKAADVFVAIEMAAELGLMPMQGLQTIGVVNGKPGVYGDGIPALIMASPDYINHEEFFLVNGERQRFLTDRSWLTLDTTAAVCIFTRRHKPTPTEQQFSIGQAKKAGLWTKRGPWTDYPDRMLQMRARGFAARDCFPDVLKGVRMLEELQDLPALQAPRRPIRKLSDALPPAADHDENTGA